jgi:hypothetical protein
MRNINRHNLCGSTQLSLVLRCFLGEDVALESLSAFDRTAWTHTKALGRAPLGFHFGHDCSIFLTIQGVLCHALQKASHNNALLRP